MGLQEWDGGLDWIDLAQDVVLYAVMNIRAS
jgi:hypothetical protein